MDGPHDVGGRIGFGPVEPQCHDAPYSEDWELRMFAIARAMNTPSDWNVDKFRFTREQIPPADYLSRPYYDQWYQSYAAMLFGSERVTIEELASGRSSVTPRPDFTGEPARYSETERKKTPRFDGLYEHDPLFTIGDRVRTRMTNALGHTRLPQYVRGHRGIVTAFNGAHILPDANADGVRKFEPLYTVEFRISELFEENNSKDVVHLDLWETYLAPA